jgi:radical SAM superfamily enzyme YgiQ (UPF0313 family)
MNLLIIEEICLSNLLSSFDKSVFSAFSFISSVYARQLAAVTPKHHSVRVLEGNDSIDFEEEYDAVHINFKTATAPSAYKVAEGFRRRGRTVILSGYHPSALPEEAIEHADSVIIGSAENLWPVVVKDLEKDQLKQFYSSKNTVDVKSFPETHSAIPSVIKLVDAIEATRGCPYQCDFCQDSNIPDGSIFRSRPIEEVIQEIRLLPHKLFVFCDTSLTIDPSYTKKLFTRMIGLDKKFICEGNVNVLADDNELLSLSQKAGCIQWMIGFESFSQHTLDSVHKKTNKIRSYKRAVDNIHNHHMAVLGTFIFGFDTDTIMVFDTTEDCVQQLEIDSAHFAILTPYPGTPLYKQLTAEGRILTRDWSKYNRKNVVFDPKQMSTEELQNGFERISENFNTIPKLLYRDLRSLGLGLYPFLTVFASNLGNYMNRPMKWKNK